MVTKSGRMIDGAEISGAAGHRGRIEGRVKYGKSFGAKGNPDLLPEEVRTAEIVWENRLADVLFGVLSLYRFTVSTEIRYETERTTVYDTEIEPVLLTNASVSTRQLFDRLRLWVTINNLFDVEYTQPGGLEHSPPALLQHGRRIDATISVRF